MSNEHDIRDLYRDLLEGNDDPRLETLVARIDQVYASAEPPGELTRRMAREIHMRTIQHANDN